MRCFRFWGPLFAGVVAMGAPAAADDLPGSSDHPALGARYPQSQIVRYQQTEFEAYALLTGPVAKAGTPGDHEELEGRLTRISYEVGAERSTLEVMRNYELALAEKGFETLWVCKNAACGGRAFNHTVVPYWPGFAENYSDQRYLAARDMASGVHVALYVVKNGSEGGERHNRVYAQLDVIEMTPMAAGLEVVVAAEMQQAIDADGHIALYGILFDVDKADIRPDSRSALDEVGKLLTDNSSLKLFVVGHTDNQGTLAYNLDLSKRRAQAVVADLVATYGVAAERLDPHGLAFLAPVASHASEEGRQKNRRVELVAQ